MQPGVLGCSQVFWDAVRCFGMQSGVLGCSQVFWMSDIATSLYLSVGKWCVLSREFRCF